MKKPRTDRCATPALKADPAVYGLPGRQRRQPFSDAFEGELDDVSAWPAREGARAGDSPTLEAAE